MPPASYAKIEGTYDPATAGKSELKVDITYCAGRTVYYNCCSFWDAGLLEQFRSAVSACELNGVPTSGKMVGILTQMSFHGPRDSINYYAGTEITGPVPPWMADRAFTFAGGKFARFSTNASYHNFWELMMQFKTQWLDSSPYLIREIFAFEDISPENRKADYPFLQRTIYVPIRYK